jgi:hypothetical protein
MQTGFFENPVFPARLGGFQKPRLKSGASIALNETQGWTERDAYHEAGHTIAALTYGLPIVSVTIESNRPHMLRDRFRRERSSAVEALAIVCLSGPAGEAMFCGPGNDDSDLIDRRMARDYLATCFPAAQIRYQMTRMRYGAERLVASTRREITTIATALLKHGSMTGDEIIALLNGATASWVR